MFKRQRTIVVLLSVALISAFALGLLKMGLFPDNKAYAYTMSSITSEGIKDKEKQIANAEQEKKNMQSAVTNLNSLKASLISKKNDLKAYVAELDANLAVIEANIEDMRAQIAVKEGEIDVATRELEEALAIEEERYTSMVARMKLLYEKGDSYIVEMLLKTANFSNFLNEADYYEKVMSYDRSMYEDYKLTREYAELCKIELETEKEILDTAKANLDAEEAALQELIDQKETDIRAYESDIANKEAAIREYEEEIKAEEAEIEALEAAILAEKKSILKANGIVLTYDGGAFVFPVAKYTRVSDDYGYRIHPTLHVQQFHNGVDLASPYGTAIYAAYDGVVVAATYSGTMGNYVMIDHGDGLYTIYMHASALHVKEDDIVARGEKIASVGSTGRSTGNHLHFSVRKDGSYVSPWNYISK